ncbi:unnamed protein product [Closterium sp. NIES-65]|nr:unnamed protein product [Closterium sp. NIES-65]
MAVAGEHFGCCPAPPLWLQLHVSAEVADVSVGSLPDEGEDRREIGHLAVWSVSSAKPGNGVELLRDGKADTFWQLRIHVSLHVDFKLDESYTPNKVSIRAGNSFHDVKLCFACALDGSYTPNKVSIRAGNSFHDVKVGGLLRAGNATDGACMAMLMAFPVASQMDMLFMLTTMLPEVKLVEMNEPSGWVHIPLRPSDDKEYLRAFYLQLAVISNHQNGRDTHIRQINIYGPRQNVVRAVGVPMEFNTVEFGMYAAVR